MTDDFQVRPMSLEDLSLAVDWAAAEGWNPGLEDAEAFHGVDPQGFLMGWLDGVPITAVSVVKHSATFGFLGFYLCRPEVRGMGYGLATWQAGMTYMGACPIGLDGVPAQEENYKRSGFFRAHYTHRYAGSARRAAHTDCRLASPDDLETLLTIDRRISGAQRNSYLSKWLGNTKTRQTLVYPAAGQITGFGTIRTCREGHKIGPLFADDTQSASRLFGALAQSADAQTVFLDVPDPNKAGVSMATQLGLNPVFSCARMYRGQAPVRQINNIFGETTFELG